MANQTDNEIPESDFEKAEIIFSILLDNPQGMEVSVKPSAQRGHNFACTMNSDNRSIASSKADDNGAYCKKRSPKKHYCVKDGVCKIAHKDERGWYIGI